MKHKTLTLAQRFAQKAWNLAQKKKPYPLRLLKRYDFMSY